jgi:LacI family transcriptional regulator
MMEKRVLLKDIAKASNLTINTVSRALKNKDDISVATREYVQKLALEMGYIPDVVASSLRSGYTKTIGIMFDNIANPYYMIMTNLIHQELKKDGYEMMIFTASGDRAKFDMDSFHKIISRRIDGIISFLKPTDEVVKAIKANRVPFVILGREGDDIGIDSIYTNDLLGGYQIGEYLFNKGHQKIGYIGAPKDILCSVKRLEGLRKYLNEQNIENKNEYNRFLIHGDLSLEEMINDLLSKEVTAIFCFNDTMAYEAITLLNSKGLKVPEDIAVAGYDNLEEYIHLPVYLTTIDSNKQELTQKVIQTLKMRMSSFDLPLVKLVNSAKLVARKSA